MKVLYVSDSTTLSGAEIVMLGCVDALYEQGHQARGFVRHSNPRLIEAFRSRGVPVTATHAYSDRLIQTTANPRDLWSFARSFAQASAEMAQIIERERIDVIHSISYPASLYAAFASLRTGVAHLWHEHNIKRIHRANRVIYRLVGNSCRWVVGPSDAVTNNLATSGIAADRLRTVYNGIDLSRFGHSSAERTAALRRELGVGDHESAVGLFGQMLPYKGHRTLIDAAPEILRQQPNTRFFLVGALENPPYQDELKSMIAARGLDDRMIFTGWRDNVPEIIRAMDVVVVGTTTPEPAALTLMEGGAMERAVVATRTGGTPEIVADGESGLLFAPGDAAALAVHVSRLLGDPALAARLGQRARRRVEEEFERSRHLSQMFDLYREAAASNTARASGGLEPATARPPRVQ